jgi:hypothetical protein
MQHVQYLQHPQQQNGKVMIPTPNAEVEIIATHMAMIFYSTVSILIEPPAETASWEACRHKFHKPREVVWLMIG